MPSTSSVKSEGLFHGLPTFPSHVGKKRTAIVTGANGISGQHLVRVLSANTDVWETIYALSRRAPAKSTGKSHVKHIAVDFLDNGPKEIANILKRNGVKADYVFFNSYLQVAPKAGEGLWSDTEEMGRVNLKLLSNFLEALTLASAIPKRFLLQTGGKHYGVHLGPTSSPETEDDPRFLAEPNFYFDQEDLLWDWAKKNNTHWNVTRPGFIIGAVKEAAMNIVHPLAVYAAIQAHLGASLDFPGDIQAWDVGKDLSTAMLISYHAEWAVLTEEAADEVLNHSDSSHFSYGKFWPVLASWYNIPYTLPNPDASAYKVLEMPTEPPPRGFGSRGKVNVGFSFAEWAQKPEVLAAWEELKEKHGLEHSPFDDSLSSFGLIDGEILGPWPRALSMDKSRKLGWNGYVDSKDAILDTIHELAKLKMVPDVLVKAQANGTSH
ncbi:MAG: hypothetical protein M1824_001538 [Vezdaea acicularis]|nr:MAG: hypothetical protein M1824_001538 [Vezdaea acicularis]